MKLAINKKAWRSMKDLQAFKKDNRMKILIILSSIQR